MIVYENHTKFWRTAHTGGFHFGQSTEMRIDAPAPGEVCTLNLPYIPLPRFLIVFNPNPLVVIALQPAGGGKEESFCEQNQHPEQKGSDAHQDQQPLVRKVL